MVNKSLHVKTVKNIIHRIVNKEHTNIPWPHQPRKLKQAV